MKLIFDSGSTKTSVALVNGSESHIFDLPAGHNAISAKDGELASLISSSALLIRNASAITDLYFYGAGCATPESCRRVATELSDIFTTAHIEVASDMLGAARAACGHSPGIVGILGTGSNSCLYDGRLIVDNVPALGYIIGDEGSGAVLGRLFVERLYKGLFGPHLIHEFECCFHITAFDIITRVYREPQANAFLASFAPFILKKCDREDVNRFVIDEFLRYIRYNLRHYDGFDRLPIHFIGSIASYFKAQLTSALREEGKSLGLVIQSPITPLTKYHR